MQYILFLLLSAISLSKSGPFSGLANCVCLKQRRGPILKTPENGPNLFFHADSPYALGSDDGGERRDRLFHLMVHQHVIVLVVVSNLLSGISEPPLDGFFGILGPEP